MRYLYGSYVILKLCFRLDKFLCSLLKDYAGKGATHDFQKIQTGSTKPTALQQLLVLAASDLQRYV